ncbi:MAG: peroxiredoxin-like family protein [Aestuariivirgaceae bacterium]
MTPPFAANTLAECLAAYADELRTSGSPFAGEYDRLIDRLKAGSLGALAPAVGEAMPGFLLPDQDGHIVSLDGLLAAGPLVISFNRGHWCPFCRIELDALDAAHEDLARLGARVVSIMPDRQPYTRELARRFVHPLTILTDMDNDYALSLGLAMWVGAEVRALLVEDGTMLPHYQGSDAWVLPLPATFVLRQDGRVAARYVNPDFRERMEIADVIAALQS